MMYDGRGVMVIAMHDVPCVHDSDVCMYACTCACNVVCVYACNVCLYIGILGMYVCVCDGYGTCEAY